MRPIASKILCLCLLASTISTWIGCGSSSSSPATPTSPSNPTPPAVTVTLNQSTASIDVGATSQFTATVTGSSNTAVTWSVNKVNGGNSTVGTISSAGLYTAPTVAGRYSVTATSVVNTAKSASATVTVAGLLAVSPGSANIPAGGTQQFTATAQGLSNTAVTWSVDQIAGGNAAVGTITPAGVYTAPVAVATHTITATSAASTALSANAAVNVFSLSVTPAAATVEGTQTQQFTATISGLSGATVNWSVNGVAGGNATVGMITGAGLYTAPSAAGSYTIAASVADTSAAQSAVATVFTFTVSPTSATIAPSATEQFTATEQGLTSGAVTWSVDGAAGGNSTTGTISATGLYSAPATIGFHNVTATSTADSSAVASASLTVINISQASVLTYHNDDARDGAYLEEVQLTPANVTSAQFGKIVSYPVDGQIYAQPLYLPQIAINGGIHDVVFVETQNNSVYAFDADATATEPALWQVNLGPPVTKDDYTGVNPVVGILSTPVIDTSTNPNTIYLVAETSNVGANNSPFFLHALNAATGADLPGSPAVINATDSGSGETLTPDCYQRMGLALNPVTNWIYIAFGSCAHGWVVAYDKTTLTQEAVFNDTSGAAGGGLWASDGAPAIDDATGNVYLMSGTDNGDQTWIQQPPAYTQIGYNDSFLYLNASTLTVESYFSPDNNYTLAVNDADLGSGSPVLIGGNTTYPKELVGGGKDGNVYVVDPLDMGGFNSTNNVLQTVHIGTQQYNNIFSTPVYWNGSLYYHCDKDVLRAFSWTAGASAGSQLSTTSTSQATEVYSSHGATASLSANGATNGIIWDIDNSAYNQNDATQSGPAVLHAYDATNVANELYNSSQAANGRDTAGLALKFTVPTIAGGRVFVSTSTELDIYGELAAQ